MAEATTTGPRASFGTRLVAVIIDGLIVGAAQLVLSAIVGQTAGQGLGALLGLGYFIYLEGSPSGQSVGKKVMNIRIVDADTGGPIGYGRAAVRYIGRLVSGFVCALGYLWMLWDGNKQTWHDKFATSVVVPTADYPVDAWPG